MTKLTHRAKGALTLARSALRFGRNLVAGRWVEARLPGDLAPRTDDRFVACAYFSSDLSSLYQLEQWLWSFEQCADALRTAGHGDEPFGIIVRDATVASRVRHLTRLPVRFARLTRDFDTFMAGPRLRVAFYVNQAMGNFQALRFPRPAHVHLSHGESEKISMISNQLKAYDFIFTAGPEARARIRNTLIGMDDDHMIDVGRPPLDRPRTVPDEWRRFAEEAPAGPVVFWTPTWEGDSPAMAYGTLANTGVAIADDLLAAGYRVIFRPHPRTGVRDSAFLRARADVEKRIADHPRGYLDRTPGVDWQFDAADIAMAEMSSVAFDWLATRKPLVMIAPHHPGAEVLAGGLLDRTPSLCPSGGSDIVELLSQAGSADRVEDIAHLSRDYLGDTDPGSQITRFIAAAEEVISTRSAQIEERTAPEL